MFQKFSFRLMLLPVVISLVVLGSRSLQAAANPVVGSRNVSIADPALPVPSTTPCTVQLFPKENFGARGANNNMGAVPHPFTYHPPARCKGPWAKVVLVANFSVDPGHQYDRTASFWLNGVNIYFGTTEEPSPDFGPSWQIERDLTDYSALLRKPGKGDALINNWVDSNRGSMIHATAKILFYPADASYPAPRTPDNIYALNPSNAPDNLQTGSQEMQRKIEFPRNTERVYVDVFPQSQFHDEFWYTCLPDKYIQQTSAFAMKRGYKGAPRRPRACSGGNYREVEVLVDGQPAGLAPVYPWVFTGGIDPFLWRPTPGVQTLNFVPYRIDLTPFAGLLSDGAPHTVAVKVLGANHYFSVAAALLVYRDHNAQHTGGAVTRNTLKGASLEPVISSTLGSSTTEVNGDVITRALQSYAIEGYVNTPAGRVTTSVQQHLTFGNAQNFSTAGAGATRHIIEQTAHAQSSSVSTGGNSHGRSFRRALDYSLTVNTVRKHVAGQHGGVHSVHLHQIYNKTIEQRQAGLPPYLAHTHNERISKDQVTFGFKNGHFSLYANKDQHSTQNFSFTNSLGDCYHAVLKASGGKVSSFTTGQGCRAKPLHWFVQPTGLPNSFGWRK